jgi:hypothetical protein
MWLTANTFFERSKHHRAWLGGIWLREHGISVSASKFQRLVGDISYSSALAIHKKLAVVIHSQMHENFVSAPSVDFRKAVCRRSRQTFAGQSPAEEALIPPESRELQKKSTELDNFLPSTDSHCNIKKNLAHNLENDLTSLFPGEETSEAENEILGILSAEPLSIDSLIQRAKLPTDQCLSVMTMLELKGLAINVGKNRYTGVLQKKLKAVTTCALGAGANLQTLISAALDFIKSKFHGISHKYLQYYLAEYWCHVDRDRWLPGSLLRACHESDRVTYKDLLAYESPSELKIWAANKSATTAKPTESTS